MEWVETTGRTVDEAKELALDQLGVSIDDAEFEVLEEPRPGLFGRVRGRARVRARVRPTTPRAKAERRERRPKKAAAAGEASTPPADDETDDEASVKPAPRSRPRRTAAEREVAAAASTAAPSTAGQRRPPARRPERARAEAVADEAAPDAGLTRRTATAISNDQGGPDVSAEQVGEEAIRFLGGLLDAFGLQGTSTLTRDGDELEVRVDGDELGLLIGPRGATLLAVQDLTRVVSQRRLGDHETRLRIDIGGYRERRREALSRFTEQQAEAALSTGLARALEPMPSADRKVIHDTVAGIDGVTSRSEGDDPFRRVVIVPSVGD